MEREVSLRSRRRLHAGAERVSHGQALHAQSRFMPEVCKKLSIVPLGFHALRRKSAAIVYGAQGLQDAQRLLGHYRATTDRCVRSANLHTQQEGILEALERATTSARQRETLRPPCLLARSAGRASAGNGGNKKNPRKLAAHRGFM